MRRLWIGLITLVLLSPLGLILPAKLGAGSAWGEWSAEEIGKLIGYLPAGFRKPEPWSAPMPDYALKGQENAGLGALSLSYILSGAVGVVVVMAVSWGLGRLLGKKDGVDAA